VAGEIKESLLVDQAMLEISAFFLFLLGQLSFPERLENDLNGDTIRVRVRVTCRPAIWRN